MNILEVKVTPEYAKELLLRNSKNRSLSKSRVEAYSRAMRNGEWKLNGETIKVGKDGVLLDGQHRLQAVVEFGNPVNLLVALDLEPDIFDTVDQGRSRTRADVLNVAGCKYYIVAAAVTSLIVGFEKTGRVQGFSAADAGTATEVLNRYNSDAEIQEIVKKIDSMTWCRAFLNLTITGFCMSEFRKFDRDLADKFFNQLETGEGLNKYDPALALRSALMLNKASSKKYTKAMKIAMVFNVFRRFVKGESVKKIVVTFHQDERDRKLFVV